MTNDKKPTNARIMNALGMTQMHAIKIAKEDRENFLSKALQATVQFVQEVVERVDGRGVAGQSHQQLVELLVHRRDARAVFGIGPAEARFQVDGVREAARLGDGPGLLVLVDGAVGDQLANLLRDALVDRAARHLAGRRLK